MSTHRAFPWIEASLLFGSGTCGLVYQTVWLRELRVVFGASTLATSAVLALFLGGLGAGGLWLGRKAEKTPRPLHLYGVLELGIATLAALSPLVLEVCEAAYLRIGGSSTLGDSGATIVRLLLGGCVLLPCTILMGGTLPAMARAATDEDDTARKKLALLYGMNTSGAVLGALVPAFFLFEILGVRKTLLLAALLNAVIAIVALSLARRRPALIVGASTDADDNIHQQLKNEADPSMSSEPPTLVARPGRMSLLMASFGTGFVFVWLELVWYRMSAPILGGTTYTFALVLALALLGIGLGGLAFGRFGRASPGAFLISCLLQAVCVVLPYAGADSIARLTAALRAGLSTTFFELGIGWAFVASLMVFPAALVAGWQFPLLLALAGQGRHAVARDTGDIYAANTAGSIVGSLVGGFVLIPLWGAPQAWRASAAGLVVVGLIVGWRGASAVLRGAAIALAGFALLLSQQDGPSALWRHSGLGAGRYEAPANGKNGAIASLHRLRQSILEEHEGRESSLAFQAVDGLALVTNGKVDGDVVGDAMTTVGLGMIPAILHPSPKRAFVIGLASGETAGFLGDVPGMEQVDVAEIEPATLRFSELASKANRNVLQNPRVHVLIGDGRELLATASTTYDLIVSEPSNPYRAGLAGFYSEDFLLDARQKLAPGGIFALWLQAYEVDARAIQTVASTMHAVFPHVTLWRLLPRDLLLIATLDPLEADVPQVDARLQQDPYFTAFARVFGAFSSEDVLAHHLAGNTFVEALSDDHGINTDDDPTLEFMFARAVGASARDHPAEILALARRAHVEQLPTHGRAIDVDLLEASRWRAEALAGLAVPPNPLLDAFSRGTPAQLAARASPSALEDGVLDTDAHRDLFTLRALAEAQALAGTSLQALEPALEILSTHGFASDAAVIRAEGAVATADESQLDTSLPAAFESARADPFIPRVMIWRLLQALEQAPLSTKMATKCFEILSAGPLAGWSMDEDRREAARVVLGHTGTALPPSCVAFFTPDDAYPTYTLGALQLRRECYVQHASERVAEVTDELRDFVHRQGASLEDLLLH